MGMPASSQPDVTTIEELLALPDDGRRHELLRAQHVVTPSPRPLHQVALRHLARALESVLGDRDDVSLLSSPADIVLEPNTLVQPDLFVLQVDENKPLRDWADAGVPLLVAEIISPSTARRDRGVKRTVYQEAGVSEYWVVDLDAELIERWRLDDERPEVLTATLRWELPGGANGEIDLKRLFAKIAK